MRTKLDTYSLITLGKFPRNALDHLEPDNITTMVGSSLHPVVCRKARVLFTLFVFVWFVFTSSCL